MNLSTTARVLALISSKGTAPANADTEVAAVLATVSGAVEAYLGRYVESTARTEYFDVAPLQRIFRLRGAPVSSLASIYFDEEQAFGSSTALVSTDYRLPTLDPTGALWMRFVLNSGPDTLPRSLKVTYTGGMATSAANFVTNYPDLAGAVDVQASHEWQRRNALGVSSISYPDGTTASLSFDRWIPSVKQVLDRYRMVSAG